MAPKIDGQAVEVTPEMLHDLLARSTQASTAVTNALDTLPGILAQALRDVRAAAPAAEGAGAAAAAAEAAVHRPVTSRDLRDRKVPDFWLAAPEAWFQILDEHLSTANPALSEAKKFAILLPLLQDQAVKVVLRLVRSPTPTVYQTAKETLIRTFKRSDDDMIAELFALSSLGDRSAVEHLEHMRSLQPSEPETKLFRPQSRTQASSLALSDQEMKSY